MAPCMVIVYNSVDTRFFLDINNEWWCAYAESLQTASETIREKSMRHQIEDKPDLLIEPSQPHAHLAEIPERLWDII
jgi:hypothetical protein